MSGDFLRPNDDRYGQIKIALEKMLGGKATQSPFSGEGKILLDLSLSPQGIIRVFDDPEFQTSSDYDQAIKALFRVEKLAEDFGSAVDGAMTSLDGAANRIPIKRREDGGVCSNRQMRPLLPFVFYASLMSHRFVLAVDFPPCCLVRYRAGH